ncbi:hypothetical protein EDD11_001181 [Mortierella claussenii]|nr:hypothetical protein EDD11_001181 [Mortierella claussenii]
MVRSKALTDIERATLKKAKVSTVPSWAQESHSWKGLLEGDEDNDDSGGISSSASSTIGTEHGSKLSSTLSLLRTPGSTMSGSPSASRASLPKQSRKRHQKHSMEITRGYPTGQCISSSEPPPTTTWDEQDPDDLLLQERRQSISINTAINVEAFKMFLNSPLFSNILKSLSVMASVSLFAIAVDALLTLHKDMAPRLEDADPFSNATACLIITIILSIFTVIYSCFTIFLESRRPPEGLDSSNSKPLIVIFSEILVSIVWAQVLSVTIYIHAWTFGCTNAGQSQLHRLWKLDGILSDHDSMIETLCRREGAMVGLEVLLVLLLIFDFYTHLAQNFQFIRAVSR